MRGVPGKSPIWSLLVLAAVLSACSPEQAETTTSTRSPADTTTSTTRANATTLAEPTTTQPDPATTASASAEPAEADDLLVVGDWGSGTLPQGAVAGAMLRYAEDNEVEAILTTGDNFYIDDTEFLMQPFGWAVDADIPFWITWGNQDVVSEERIGAVEGAFDDPPRWEVYQWGAVDVIVLDSTQMESAEQSEFFTEAMASSDDPTIVALHHPPYSCGTDEGTATVEEQWLDGLDDDVFLVLSGHEHNYQRYEETTRTYVVTGGGGAGLTELAPCTPGGPEMVAGESIHHFLVLEQDDDVTVTALDVNGGVIDQFTLGLP